MASRSKGFIELEWTCPNCDTRNKGSLKACGSCGAPQPENVKFEAPREKKFVADEKAQELKVRGADIHCGFCGTRNSSTAKTCSQCGAELSEGTARQAGREMDLSSAPIPEKLTCANCGTENPGENTNCQECGAPLPRQATPAPASENITFSAPGVGPASAPAASRKKPNFKILGAIGVAVLLCCVVVGFLLFVPSSSMQGLVTGVYWETSVPVQEIRPVDYNNRQGNPPSGAYNVSCETKSEEVCQEKTIDRGNGYAEVVEECHTETDQFCDYTLDEWTTIQTYTLDGHDTYPVYEQPSISSDQRLGDPFAEFTVYFETDKGEKTYDPNNEAEFQQFRVGSTWTLKLNLLGGIVDVER